MKTSAEDSDRVLPLDLTGAERKLSSGTNTLARVSERFVKGARRFMPFLTRLRAGLAVREIATGAPAASGGTNGPAFVVHLANEEGAWGMVVFDALVLGLVLEGTLGADVQARDGNSEPTFGKEMTAAQKAVLSRVCNSVAMHFAQAIATVSGPTLDVQPAVALRSGSTFDVPKDALRCECEFEGLDTEAGITLLLGAEALAAGNEPENAVQEPENPLMVEAVGNVSVQVVAELGTVELGLRRVLSLRRGDTLRLSTPVEEPIALKVAGIAKFDVSPVIARGQLAVQIKGRRRRDA